MLPLMNISNSIDLVEDGAAAIGNSLSSDVRHGLGHASHFGSDARDQQALERLHDAGRIDIVIMMEQKQLFTGEGHFLPCSERSVPALIRINPGR